MIISNCGAGKDSWAFLGINEIKQVNLKGNQPWILFARADAEAEAPIFWPPDAKSWLIGKDPDAGKRLRAGGGGWQRMRWLDGITDSMDMNFSKLRKMVRHREAWRAVVYGVAKIRTRPSNRTGWNLVILPWLKSSFLVFTLFITVFSCFLLLYLM